MSINPKNNDLNNFLSTDSYYIYNFKKKAKDWEFMNTKLEAENKRLNNFELVKHFNNQT